MMSLSFCVGALRNHNIRFWGNARGAAAVVTALSLMAIMGAAAVSVDTATFYVTKRNLQSATDLAAAAAAADLTHANAAVLTTLAANGFPTASVRVTPGLYKADPTIAVSSRFIAGGSPANAASIYVTTSAPMIFGRVFAAASGSQNAAGGSVVIGAAGMASLTPAASFAIGSRLASLNGGVTNAVLSSLTGSTIALTAVDYESLASAKVDMGGFLRALAPSLGLQAGTYGSVLTAPITLNQALTALKAAGVNTQTSAAISNVLNTLSGGGSTFTLSGLFDLGRYDQISVTTIPPVALTMTAYEVLSGAVTLASAGRQATADLGIAIPGILGAKLTLLVGSRPASAMITGTSATTTASTTQVRLGLTVSAAVPGIAAVQLPLVVDLARSVATAAPPTCSANSPTLALAVAPSVATMWIGQTTLSASTLSPSPAPVVTLLGIPISGYASASISNVAPVNQTFVASDVTAGTVKSTSTSDPVASLLASVLGSLQLSVGGTGAQLPALLTPLVSGLTSGLQGVAVPADSLLTSITAALGVRIGQADTWVTGMSCGAPVVTQ